MNKLWLNVVSTTNSTKFDIGKKTQELEKHQFFMDTGQAEPLFLHPLCKY